MNNPAKSKSILGIISLVIAVLIGICFSIFLLFSIILRDKAVLWVWVVPTLITAPIGIILGLIAVFTKRAWLGLSLNALFLLLDFAIIVGTIIYAMYYEGGLIWR